MTLAVSAISPSQKQEELPVLNVQQGVWEINLYMLERTSGYFLPKLRKVHFFSHHLLLAAVSIAISKIAGEVYSYALRTLGERKADEPFMCSRKNGLRLTSLRQKVGKIIDDIERLSSQVDKTFSRVFCMRSLANIHDQKVKTQDLVFLEIVRKVFLEQIKAVVSFVIVREMGVCVLQAGFGYAMRTNLGTYGLLFFCDFINKINMIYLEKWGWLSKA